MTATLLSQTGKITRQELHAVPAPLATATHQPLPHHEIVEALLETLGFRSIAVVRDEYAVSRDGMRMFGVLELEYGITGVRFSIGIRNANDKSMRLSMCIGFHGLDAIPQFRATAKLTRFLDQGSGETVAIE